MGDKTNTSLDLHTKLHMINARYTVRSGLGYAVCSIPYFRGHRAREDKDTRMQVRLSNLPTETGCLTYLIIIYRLMDRIRHCLLIFYHNSCGLHMPFKVSLIH